MANYRWKRSFVKISNFALCIINRKLATRTPIRPPPNFVCPQKLFEEQMERERKEKESREASEAATKTENEPSELSGAADKKKKKKKNRLFFTCDSALPKGIQTEDDAKILSKELLPGERKLLFDVLRKFTADQYNEHKKVTDSVIHHDDLKKIWYINFIPMFIYGVVDESFLIIGGESINYFFSIYNGMSMLASAAVANVLCNLFLQIPVDRSLDWFNVKKPVLSTDQMNTMDYRNVSVSARLIGLWCGLTLGMIPLFYIDDNMDRRSGEAESSSRDWFLAADKPWHRDLMSDEYCDLKEQKESSSGEKAVLHFTKTGAHHEE